MCKGEGEKNFRDKSFTFFLRSTEIGPLIFVGAIGKFHLRDES